MLPSGDYAGDLNVVLKAADSNRRHEIVWVPAATDLPCFWEIEWKWVTVAELLFSYWDHEITCEIAL